MAKPGQVEKSEQGPLNIWSIFLLILVAAGMVIASALALARALKGSAEESKASLPEKDAIAAASAVRVVTYAPLTQEEIDRDHAANYMPPPPRPVAKPPPTTAPTNKPDPAVILQQTKNSVNRKLVEKLRQYARDNPHRDSRELQRQIELREKQIVPVPEEKTHER